MWGLGPARESQMTCAPWLSHLCLCPSRSHCPPNFKIPHELHKCKYCEYCRYCEYSKYSCTVLRKKLYFSSAPYLDFLAPVLIAQIFCSLSQQFAVFRFSNLTVSVENLCYNLDWEAQKKKHAAVLPSWPIYTSRSDFLLLRMCSQAAQVCIGLLPISPTVLTNWLLPPHVVVRHGNISSNILLSSF